MKRTILAFAFALSSFLGSSALTATEGVCQSGACGSCCANPSCQFRAQCRC